MFKPRPSAETHSLLTIKWCFFNMSGGEREGKKSQRTKAEVTLKYCLDWSLYDWERIKLKGLEVRRRVSKENGKMNVAVFYLTGFWDSRFTPWNVTLKGGGKCVWAKLSCEHLDLRTTDLAKTDSLLFGVAACPHVMHCTMLTPCEPIIITE